MKQDNTFDGIFVLFLAQNENSMQQKMNKFTTKSSSMKVKSKTTNFKVRTIDS